MNIAIVPARGGSRRIVGKNIRLFHGRPVIWYSLSAIAASGLFGKIVVSTDDDEIAAAVRSYAYPHIEVIRRPAHLARDEVGTQEVAKHALSESMGDYTFACVVYATAPLMTVGDLKLGYRLLHERPSADYAFAVNVEPLYGAGSFYWGRATSFLSGAPLVSQDSVMVPIPPERVCDINVECDWQRAEAMYAALYPERVT